MQQHMSHKTLKPFFPGSMLGPTFLIECDISLLIYVASGLGPLGGRQQKSYKSTKSFPITLIFRTFIHPLPSFVLQTFPADHLGRIFFSLTFDYTTESLSAHIKKIKNLPRSTKEGGITNKTYVK